MESANDTPQRESSLLLPSQEFWSRRRPVEWQRPLPRQVRFARSQEEYQRLIHLWLATNKASATQIAERVRLKDPAIKIETVTLHYREFAAGYYVKNGKPTKEFVEMGLALRPVRILFGNTPAVEFGPLRLKAVREHKAWSFLAFIGNDRDRAKLDSRHSLPRLRFVFDQIDSAETSVLKFSKELVFTPRA